MDRAKWKRRRGKGERGKFFQIIRFSRENEKLWTLIDLVHYPMCKNCSYCIMRLITDKPGQERALTADIRP